MNDQQTNPIAARDPVQASPPDAGAGADITGQAPPATAPEGNSPPEGHKGAREELPGQPASPPAKQALPETVLEPVERPVEGSGPPAEPAADVPAAAPEHVADPRDARTSPEAARRIAELEAQLAAATAKIAVIGTEHQAALGAVQQSIAGQLSNAAGRYRAIALEHNPDVPAELVEGRTLDEIDASLAKAKTIVARVRAQLADQQAQRSAEALEAAAQAVPGGAPVRTGPDVDSLSPIEKIKYSLAHRKK